MVKKYISKENFQDVTDLTSDYVLIYEVASIGQKTFNFFKKRLFLIIFRIISMLIGLI